MNNLEQEVWLSFKEAVSMFLSYKYLFTKISLEICQSLKRFQLHEFTFGIFPENCAELYEDQGERFHQYIRNQKMVSETMRYWYNGGLLLCVLLGHTRNKATNHC